MARNLLIRKPRWDEACALEVISQDSLHPGVRRRAEAVLLYAAGLNLESIAKSLGAHPNTISADLHAFDEQGVDAVEALEAARSARNVTPEQQAAICQIADLSPVEFGLPWGRWSLAKLRDWLVANRLVKSISREHLRRVLKKGRCAWCGSGTRSCATIRSARRFWPEFGGFGSICPGKVGCCSSISN
jgi:transposase